MKIAIVGAEGAKFTERSEKEARRLIRGFLQGATMLVSGGCHLGGIDIWAEEEADKLGIPKKIFLPKELSWPFYKHRNLQIAVTCDQLINITVDKLPENFTGMRFDYCYHCHTKNHIKSGGCWTLKQTALMGKPVTAITLAN